MSLRVSAGSRIHIALADMGFASPRAYGGVGFMIDKVAADIELAHSTSTSVVGTEDLDDECACELAALLKRLERLGGATVRIVIHGHARQHAGFGTKTALKLAIASGYFELIGRPASRTEQQGLAGRGGASGIGSHGFFEGGVLWDAGRLRHEVMRLLPSSALQPSSPSLLMLRLPFPKNWKVGLCLPEATGCSGLDEKRFFEENAPVAPCQALETMALLYHGVLPAFRTECLELLSSSLQGISQTGFKRREIERCGKRVINLLDALHAKGYAACMSSMGPLVYVILASTDAQGMMDVETLCLSHDAQWLGCHEGRNSGAIITRAA